MARSICNYGAEEWKPVPGHGNCFVASTLGRIARVVGHSGANGYQQISFIRSMKPFKAHSQGKKWPGQSRGYAHHLVALAFWGKPPKGKNQVNHKDLNRANNRPENLEWCDQRENLAHWRRMRPDQQTCGRPWKSSVAEWRKIRKLHAKGMSLRSIAKLVSLTTSGVRHVIRSPKYREEAINGA